MVMGSPIQDLGYTRIKQVFVILIIFIITLFQLQYNDIQ